MYAQHPKVSWSDTPSAAHPGAPEHTTPTPAPDTPLQIRSHRRAQWFWLDNELIDRYAIAVGMAGVGLYAALARYANHKTGSCFPSVARLSAQFGCTPKTLAGHLERLALVGLITVEERPGRTALITLLDLPPEPPVEDPSKNDQGPNDPGKKEFEPPSKLPDPPVKMTTEPNSPNQTKERTRQPSDVRAALGERKPKPDLADETSSWDKQAMALETPTDRPDDVLTTHELSAGDQAALESAAKVILRARWGNRVPAIVPVVQATVLELLEGLSGLWDGLGGVPVAREESAPCAVQAA